MWASEDGIPFGRLRGENRYQPLADQEITSASQSRCTGRSVRAGRYKSFAAPEAEARRRG